MRLALVFVLCAVVTTIAQPVVPARLPFVDEAAQKPDFKAFRDRLLTEANRGDYASVRRSIDRTIHFESGVYGLAEFEKEWKVRTSPQRFLRELVAVLRLGGRFQEESAFVAPYVWASFPDVEDPSLYAVVVRPSTTLFSKPVRTANVVATLSNEVIRYELAVPGWYEATLMDGRTGFVESSRVRQPSDYHATFRKIGGQWRLAEFLGGGH
jgi:hypothetical protein